MAVGWKNIEMIPEINLERQTLKKYEKYYGLLILRTPSGKPILTKEMFAKWAEEVNFVKGKRIKKKKLLNI